MTPWFELQRLVQAREAQYRADAAVARSHSRRTVRRPSRVYFALWWLCRPRAKAWYLIEDHRGLSILKS